jgi:hypothetical protein
VLSTHWASYAESKNPATKVGPPICSVASSLIVVSAVHPQSMRVEVSGVEIALTHWYSCENLGITSQYCVACGITIVSSNSNGISFAKEQAAQSTSKQSKSLRIIETSAKSKLQDPPQ